MDNSEVSLAAAAAAAAVAVADDASSSPPLTSTSYRILEVQPVSAEGLEHAGKKALAYAKVWIHPSRKLATSCVDFAAGGSWTERFVFAAADSFLRCPASAVSVQVYCTRRFRLLPDRLVGRVDCPVAGLLERGKPGVVEEYAAEGEGVLVRVGMEVWEGDAKCLGFGRGMELAMEYSELMMEGESPATRKKKKKRWHKLLQCFVH